MHQLQQQVIAFFRLASLNEEELADRANIVRFHTEPITFRNEIQALNMAIQWYQRTLAKLPTTVEEDEAVRVDDECGFVPVNHPLDSLDRCCCAAIHHPVAPCLTPFPCPALQMQQGDKVPPRLAVALSYRLTRKRIFLQQIEYLKIALATIEMLSKLVRSCVLCCVRVFAMM